jgi:carotenoid cleavage dioxygenase-like enzyme
MIITIRLAALRLARAELSKLLTIRALPASLRSRSCWPSAASSSAEPIARVHLPTRIPLGFHGSWVPDQ